MKKFDDEHEKTVMFQGDKAQKLIDLRKQLEDRSEEICQNLHKALDQAEKQLDELNKQIDPQVQSVLTGTEFEGEPVQSIGFDMKYAKDHGIIFGVKKSNPMAKFFEMLRRTVENGPNEFPNEDSIIFEEKPSVGKKWGQKENA